MSSLNDLPWRPMQPSKLPRYLGMGHRALDGFNGGYIESRSCSHCALFFFLFSLYIY